MVKVSRMRLTRTQSYSPSKSENWMCVEDPFLQIRSYICGHLIDTGVSSNMVVTLSWEGRSEQVTTENTAKCVLTITADTTPEKRQ